MAHLGSFDYRKFIKDPRDVTMGDIERIYAAVAEIYTHAPKEQLADGENWYEDCMMQIETMMGRYKDAYKKDWKIAFCECTPNMFASQPSISEKKLACLKKTLVDPNINKVVFPAPAGLHPDYKRNNEVSYDAHTRCRGLDDLGEVSMPTFLFTPTDGAPRDDVAELYARFGMIDGDIRPRRIRDVPLAKWTNKGRIHD
ncbi:MAG: hypothetical protein V1813_02390 [Candidatus Aenigmatarchaeota archaeon]